jgi:hypothetical protein
MSETREQPHPSKNNVVGWLLFVCGKLAMSYTSQRAFVTASEAFETIVPYSRGVRLLKQREEKEGRAVLPYTGLDVTLVDGAITEK